MEYGEQTIRYGGPQLVIVLSPGRGDGRAPGETEMCVLGIDTREERGDLSSRRSRYRAAGRRSVVRSNRPSAHPSGGSDDEFTGGVAVYISVYWSVRAQ